MEAPNKQSMQQQIAERNFVGCAGSLADDQSLFVGVESASNDCLSC